MIVRQSKGFHCTFKIADIAEILEITEVDEVAINAEIAIK